MGINVARIGGVVDHIYALETPNGTEWGWVTRSCVISQGFADKIWLSPNSSGCCYVLVKNFEKLKSLSQCFSNCDENLVF